MALREEKKKKMETAILKAALEVFAKKGYGAAKIAEIAGAANVGKGTIYGYHRSKEDLFFAVFLWYAEELARSSMVDAAALKGNAEDRLKAILDGIIDGFLSQIDTFAVFFDFWAAAGNPDMRDQFRQALLGMYDHLRTIISTLIKEGQKTGVFAGDGDAFFLAAGLVGSLDGMMLQAWMDRDFDIKAASTQFYETLISGMRTGR
jgi:AcrR family transcriptional regulator